MKDIVWQLLRRNISGVQIAGYAVTNLIGLLIIMVGIRLYCDVMPSEGDKATDPFVADDYAVISKKITGFGSLAGSADNTSFTPEEIAELRKQPWVKDVGAFSSARFNVSAGVEMGDRFMSTALFLESVSDDFFDVKPAGWDFRPGRDNVVPIIMSKDYLTLYNFGFASSRGLPQVSESMIGMIPVRLSISGNGHQQWLEGRVVGFSSRLNTIAVPEAFMQWANDNFADTPQADPSRLIVKIDLKDQHQAENYFAAKGYEAAGDKSSSGRGMFIMTLITGVVITIGLVISCLSIVILFLSLALLLQKNRDKIASLLLMGYRPSRVAGYYIKVVMIINASVIAIAIVAMELIRSAWVAPLQSIGLGQSSPLIAIVTGVGLMVLTTLINVLYIRNQTFKIR
ncbi:MAG: hypothetical protein NC098_00980 [Lachnoclostridium sp.]|nr:hypothetical protein [Lachnoclostridium sp.]